MKFRVVKSCKKLAVLSGIGICLLASCSQEKPRSVDEFIDDPRLLEATVVRCAAKRLELKYTAECINAREAVDRLAAREEAGSRAEMEAESMRKREALRRSQQATQEARARAEEAQRLRREAEYLNQFQEAPATTESAVPPSAPATTNPASPAPATTATPSQTEDPATTLDEVREELRRRQQSPPP